MTYKAQADPDSGKPAASGGGFGAHAGSSIRGNLFRGTGGKFQAGPGAVLQDRLAKLRAAMPKGKLRAKAGKRKKGKSGKGKLGAGTKEQQRLQNRKDALGKLTSKPNDAAMAALDALAKGGAVDPDVAGAIADETGLAERHADGSVTLSAAGKKLLSSLDKGDTAGAAAAIAGAGDKQAKQEAQGQAKEARQQATEKRKAEREKAKAERASKKKKAGGAAKPKPKASPPEQSDQAKAEAVAKNRDAVTKKMMANDTGITTQGFNALSKLSDSGEMDKGTADVLEGMGLIDKDAAGKPRVSVQGRKLLRAADKGDYDAALDAVAAGNDRAASRKQKAGEKAGKEKTHATDKASKDKVKTAQKERQTDRGLRSLSRGAKVEESQLLDMEDAGLIAFDKQNKPQLTDKGKKRLAARTAPNESAAPGSARQTAKH